jgi:hypothetical protein
MSQWLADCDEHGNKTLEGGNSGVFKWLLTSQWLWSIALASFTELGKLKVPCFIKV